MSAFLSVYCRASMSSEGHGFDQSPCLPWGDWVMLCQPHRFQPQQLRCWEHLTYTSMTHALVQHLVKTVWEREFRFHFSKAIKSQAKSKRAMLDAQYGMLTWPLLLITTGGASSTESTWQQQNCVGAWISCFSLSVVHSWSVKRSRPYCFHLLCCLFSCTFSPEGGPGMSDVSSTSWISGLSFDSTLLSPLLFFHVLLLSCAFFFFCWFFFFGAYWPMLWTLFQKILQYFSLRDRLFGMIPV